ncbi:ATP-dependent zinc metalloprotease FtsH [Corynebacterium testudinoris]|uniref:ATP-dependent zinc metalloprotease FtsH n=1 Tax=Corynebacterium testudinoris TaxID=136857 RepID=A0A0G3HF43_9CORY|nr:ATP-dependent zinc metalloprotease FtsH [Corynebacterium testudinoris]AKK09747.1 ATP-dependent metalloprotease FtsH [Corynebacterium testudinoris]MBX8996247.1 ATP-dependent zinc metalloprotease FtsH [Corynebacterium testudinoris]
MKNKRILQIGLVAAVVLISLYVFTLFTDDTRNYQQVDTSVAMAQLNDGNAKEVRIDDREQRVRIELREPITYEEREGVDEIMAQYPARTAPEVFTAVKDSGADKYTTKVTQDSFLGSMLGFLLPMLILFGLLFFFFTRMQSGGMFGFGGSKAKELTKDMPTNTFADVAGADEAVDELVEIKDFLQDPARYHALGAKIPRGVLLYGPPGTGKTLLARAVAGEAGVPFYSISGSDFVEMFVGVGASRVRDLFKQAKENSPCIIFVDEIDAVGRQRGSGMGGGHDEREQTLNQLLVEMDGFGDREGVILMAATNRPDILDPALLRPGRFDRQIPVTAPDLAGREMILNVHAKGKPLGPDADLNALAKRTAGMSGADLANVLNEAALLTARIGGNVITADALEEATDRVIGGPRREGKVISEKEKKVTAYHEGGHTLAAWALKDIERVYKVTILARGRTGGHAMTAAEDDKGMYNRDELFARLVFAMGGRAAEELVFGEPTTGASADIEQATKIARAMLTEYGMSPTLGVVKYGQEQGDPFSGRGGGGTLEVSPAIAAKIDEETHRLLDAAHEQAYNILRDNRDYLDRLAEKLLEKETLRRPDLEVLFEGIEPRAAHDIFPGENDRFARQADREPVKTPVEMAIERGEEPPKRFSLLEMSKEARAKRQAELAKEAELPAVGRHHHNGDSDTPDAPETTARYGGTPPPADWSAPGWPPKSNSYSATNGEHPGMKNYGSVAAGTAANQADSAEKADRQDPPTEVIGFRLPDHEQPESRPDSDDTAVIEKPAADAADTASPEMKSPEISTPKEDE